MIRVVRMTHITDHKRSLSLVFWAKLDMLIADDDKLPRLLLWKVLLATPLLLLFCTPGSKDPGG